MASIETPVSRRLSSVKNIIVVVSGKGGVGKSSSTVQLALALLALSPTTRVGLLDIDLTGPSLPRMLGLDGQSVHQSSSGWVPVYADRARRLGCMSIGFLIKDRNDSIVWRGPKKDGMIRQFLSEVRWGELDYLIIDTPPGTSDEHISLLTHLHPLFLSNPTRPPPLFAPTPVSILITTPQTTALNDTLKSLSFTRKLSLPVLGLVENMAGYVCPCCNEISDIFSKGGGEKMAKNQEIGWLGRIPIDTKLVQLLDAVSKGEIPIAIPEPSSSEEGLESAKDGDVTDSSIPFPLLDRYLETTSAKLWKDIAKDIVGQIKQRGEAAAEALATASRA